MTQTAFGQWKNLYVKKVKLNQNEAIQLDSVLVVPNSVSILGFEREKDFRVRNDSLVWMAAAMQDSLYVSYRRLYFPTIIRNKDPKYVYQVYEENPFDYIPNEERMQEEISTLQTNGNISRGIGFGNAQDVVVNSNLNLRINGILANDVEVIAVISDENNPIQPEGNTQQLQDFDQVYITLKKDSNHLTVGDFLMQRPADAYFMNYYKKSRGLQLYRASNTGKWKLKTGAEAALSRGRFSRNQIDGIDGNSGPYRLAGTNGEIFIIVIAGTEKVYLDGKLLERGENNDYVINYNTGEVTFTPRVLITRYSRIVVEFQYSDRNYARSVIRTGIELEKNNWSIYGHFFNEMDLKNQPFLQSLDAFDSLSGLSSKELLRLVGDEEAVISNINESSVFSTDRINYRKVDSSGTEIFVYADDPSADSIFYELHFSHVGAGNGSYRQVPSSANGKVFEYVGPNLGDYDPVEVLIAPQRLNMYVMGSSYTSERSSFGAEFSVSQLDENTFSSEDDDNNTGYGVKVYNQGKRRFKDSALTLRYLADYEMVTSGFNFIERYRDIEFNRRWNKVINNPLALNEAAASTEHIVNVGLALSSSKERSFSSTLSSYIRPQHFRGINSNSTLLYNWAGFKIGSTLEYLNSEHSADSVGSANNFISTTSFLEHAFKPFTLGFKGGLEQSDFRENDTLTPFSYGFDILELYLRDNSKKKWNYQLAVNQRRDRTAKNDAFGLSTIGRNVTAGFSYTTEKYNSISVLTTYRKLNILDSSIKENALDNSLQSRVELDFKLFKDVVRTKTFFQIGTGREQRREFQYLEVQEGNGIYIWNDYDSNGLKTLNEFELASDLDRNRANFIKVFTPVPGFISTRSTKFSETLEINPIAYLKDRKKFFAKFYNITSLLLEQKSLAESSSFLENELNDSSLINRSSNFRSTLFFNRSHPLYGMDYTFKSNQAKILLINGFDSRSNIEHSLKIRWNLKKRLSLRTTVSTGFKSYASVFSVRNFNYDFWQLEPKLQFQQSVNFRLELNTAYFTAQNQQIYGGETTENLSMGLAAKFSRPSKGILRAEANYVRVDFSGEPSSTLGYELLRGLQDGNNATWSLDYQQKLARNIQVVVSYNGRKSEDAPVIHIGRLVARYLF